ncbi:MAG: cupin domain-containing protein [Candidatus Pacearchaeota archaeon]|jgi:cupin 2 domain-containing protein|nr:cupin domain-containing protein [Candidatus Pacearchaeota archaeon]
MTTTIENLFTGIQKPENEPEIFKNIKLMENARIELVRSNYNEIPSRIYDQEEDEFVMIVKGRAKLLLEQNDKPEIVEINPGDYLTIPRHMKHKVMETEKDTYWVTVLYSPKK